MAETNAIQFLTDAQLCEMLHVDNRTTLRWRNAGGGPPFVRVGPRRILYRWVDVEAWISAHTYPHRASEAAAPALRRGGLS